MTDSTTRPRPVTVSLLAAPLAAAVLLTSAGTAAAAPTTSSAGSGCDVLHVFGLQGTGQSGDAAATDVDSGFLGSAITIPLSLAADNVGRTLIPYAASFGGKPGDSTDLPYAQSIADGLDAGAKFLADYAARCPGAKIALTGYSQGAQVASELARRIGAGDGPVPAADVAAVSLFSDPTRPANSPAFPGSPTGERPTPPPGVAADLDGLDVTAPPADGSGVAPVISADSAATAGAAARSTFGSLSGRVAQFCTAGDLACSLPAKSTIARVVTNISGQLHLQEQDPQRTLIDLAGAVGGTTLRTAADVVNDDVNFTGGQFRVSSGGDTVLGRLAENSQATSDTPEADAKIVRAVVKAGVMGFGAAVTVAKKVLTPATITELATVGLANPPAALAVLGTKLTAAVASLVPPATISSVQRRIYSEVTKGVQENEGLLTLATDVRYWDTVRLHGTYDQVPVTADGQTPAKFTVEWFTRLAAALTDDRTSSSPTGSTTSTAPTVPSGAARSQLTPSTTAGAVTTRTSPPVTSSTPADPVAGS